jgi:hypothetical protein
MLGNIAQNSSQCAEFLWIVPRNGYVVLAALSSS